MPQPSPQQHAPYRRILMLLLCGVLGACGSENGGNAPLPVSENAASAPAPALALFAGNLNGPGNTDGTVAAARFHYPIGIATDSSGNVYVADTSNSTIRKINPAGTVSTLATTASFAYPHSIATDSSGNIYVADTYNNSIRKITPAGIVTTLAGTAGVSGSADASGAAAFFNNPYGITTDSSGNIYVADTYNCTIRKITPTGVVTTLAGSAGVTGSTDATGTAARFYYPHSIATDSNNNLYVADTNNSTIRKITPAGVVTTLAGTAGVTGITDATGAAASFNFPRGIATDSSGNVYVADTSNSTIRKISPAGEVTTLAGTSGVTGSADATGAAASFIFPQGIATDSSGDVYVADTGNNSIRKITLAGIVSTLAGTASVAGSTDATGSAASFYYPQGTATDSSGNVYVADAYNYTIRKITPTGVVSTFAGIAGIWGSTDATGTAASFSYPHSIATDSSDNVYVADIFNNTIRKITPTGVVTTLAGSAGVTGSTDATGAAASFYYPHSIAIDSSGNVYVADTFNRTIRKITPSGVVTTLAGTAGITGSTDATGAAASFYYPRGIGVDSNGNVYVADSDNNTIRKITPAGVVSTLAGTAGVTGSTDATGAAARFSFPLGIDIDSSGNIYVADINNSTIRKITPAGVVSTVVGAAGRMGFVAGALPGTIANPYGVTIHGSSLYFTMANGVAVVTNLP